MAIVTRSQLPSSFHILAVHYVAHRPDCCHMFTVSAMAKVAPNHLLTCPAHGYATSIMLMLTNMLQRTHAYLMVARYCLSFH